MSDEYSRVNYAAMAGAQEALRRAHNNLRSEMDDLARELERNLADWEGDAVNEYRRAKATWDAAIAHMANVIDRASTTVATISSNYSGTDRSVANAWQNH